ncbi:MAG: DUF3368 domain-containing protein [Saprospiraceae bacterium]
MIVVSDTSPISNLVLIGRLDILQNLFLQLVIPPKVLMEVQALQDFGVDTSTFEQADWIKVQSPQNAIEVSQLLSEINRGEAEAIVLAEETKAGLLLIDERLGWRVAQRKNIPTVGLLGCLIKSKKVGYIKRVKPVIDDLQSRAGFWVGEELIAKVLNTADE